MTQTIGKVMQPAAAMAVNDWLKNADDKGTGNSQTLPQDVSHKYFLTATS